jgi:hypothetical protein
MGVPTRSEALAILEDGHRRMDDLLARLDEAALARPGLGGGDWSPLDLIGHVAFWESMALGAVTDWRAGRPAWVGTQLGEGGPGLDGLNASALEQNRAMAPGEAVDRARAIHLEVVRLVESMDDGEWNSIAPDGKEPRPVGELIGSIMGADDGGFRHAHAHLADLKAFVTEASVPS